MHEPSDWQTDGLIVTVVTNKVGPLLCNLSVMLSFTENVDTNQNELCDRAASYERCFCL